MPDTREWVVGNEVVVAMRGATGPGDLSEFLGGFMAQLRAEHRTHQQDMVRAMTQALVLYAEDPYSDLRNEASKQLCQKLAPIIKDNPLPRF